ncbi:hypothetical protein H5410_041821 [Solanum commersonii]|uniref:Uncharacterized protein n=1 Tax=Solanum commersonii TaxID=4109 RepID=A0A9J5XSM6_SOLCO|nr:hypothetical protein H5410_041821 [Solanum commersonii]
MEDKEFKALIELREIRREAQKMHEEFLQKQEVDKCIPRRNFEIRKREAIWESLTYGSEIRKMECVWREERLVGRRIFANDSI